jgi:hypothetical protein
MATNAETIAALEASKTAFEDQCNAAAGADLTKLLVSIQHIADEAGALAVLSLTASYVPQTNAFQSVTAEAKAFLATLDSLKTAFAAVAGFAAAADKVMGCIK